MKRQAVNGMNHQRQFRIVAIELVFQGPTRIAAKDARLGRVSVNNIRLKLSQDFFELEIRRNINKRIDLTP